MKRQPSYNHSITHLATLYQPMPSYISQMSNNNSQKRKQKGRYLAMQQYESTNIFSKDLFVQDTGWKCTVSYSVSYRIIIRRRCAQPSHLLLREKSMKNVSSLLPPSICSLNLSPKQNLKEAQPVPSRMYSIVYTSFKIYPSFSTLSPLFYPSF